MRASLRRVCHAFVGTSLAGHWCHYLKNDSISVSYYSCAALSLSPDFSGRPSRVVPAHPVSWSLRLSDGVPDAWDHERDSISLREDRTDDLGLLVVATGDRPFF